MYDCHLASKPLKISTRLRYQFKSLIGITGYEMEKYRPRWPQVLLASLDVVWRPQFFFVVVFEVRRIALLTILSTFADLFERHWFSGSRSVWTWVFPFRPAVINLSTCVGDKCYLNEISSSRRIWLQLVCCGWSVCDSDCKFFHLWSMHYCSQNGIFKLLPSWRVHWTLHQWIHYGSTILFFCVCSKLPPTYPFAISVALM
jgi:hypothetical protein